MWHVGLFNTAHCSCNSVSWCVCVCVGFWSFLWPKGSSRRRYVRMTWRTSSSSTLLDTWTCWAASRAFRCGRFHTHTHWDLKVTAEGEGCIIDSVPLLARVNIRPHRRSWYLSLTKKTWMKKIYKYTLDKSSGGFRNQSGKQINNRTGPMSRIYNGRVINSHLYFLNFKNNFLN